MELKDTIGSREDTRNRYKEIAHQTRVKPVVRNSSDGYQHVKMGHAKVNKKLIRSYLEYIIDCNRSTGKEQSRHNKTEER